MDGNRSADATSPAALEDELQHTQRIERYVIAGAQNLAHESPHVQRRCWSSLHYSTVCDGPRCRSRQPAWHPQLQLSRDNSLWRQLLQRHQPVCQFRASPPLAPGRNLSLLRSPLTFSDSQGSQREDNADQQPSAMQVVAQCPGDERKRADVLAAEA